MAFHQLAVKKLENLSFGGRFQIRFILKYSLNLTFFRCIFVKIINMHRLKAKETDKIVYRVI